MNIKPCSKSDIRQAADVLARGFFSKQPFTWLLPDDDLRARALPGFFEVTLKYIQPPHLGTELAVKDGNVLGVAIWAPPGKWRPSFLGQILAMPGMLRAMGFKNIGAFGQRGRQVQDALEAVHPDEPHWYLAALAVDPSVQAKGAGSLLMQSGLERCRSEGMPAYLECTETLVPYYQRFGFSALGPIAMPEGTVPQVAMRWDPAR